MNLPLHIAKRYLAAGSGRGFVSLITTVSFLGLVLGVVALLVVVSIMNGFDRELKSRILGAVPHVVVESADIESLSQYGTGLGIKAITPFQEAQLLVVSARGSQLVMVHGVDPEQETGASTLPDSMIDFDLNELQSGNGNVILGNSAARRLGVVAGDGINLVLPIVSEAGKTLRPKLQQASYVGSFSLGSELDYSLAVMHIDDLIELTNQEPFSRITMEDLFAAPILNQKLLQEGYKAEDWTQRYGDFFQTVRMEKIMMFIVLTFVIAVASFSIVAGLSMQVDAKRREIAVLRTMGMDQSVILRLFFVQGSLITIAGVGVGVVVGLPLAFYAPDLMAALESLVGFSIIEGTYFDQIPTEPRALDISLIVLITTLIGCLATLYPARQAARLEPAQILRYE